MIRSDVIQNLVDLIGAKSYLEVGVNRGETFHAVRVERKVAVDPKFLFDVGQAQQRNPNAAYHEVLSDVYFENVPVSEAFDLIYLDGLHTYDQTLRDLMNAMAVLDRNGIVVIDDVFPSSYAASLSDLRLAESVKALTGETDMSWMGDVYRLVYFIESFMQGYSYATVGENHGQLIMWRGPRKASEVGKMSALDVAEAEYHTIVTGREALVIQPLATILARITNDRARA